MIIIKHKNIADAKAIIRALVVIAYFLFDEFNSLYFALKRDTVKGIPLQQIVTRHAKTEKAIWYMPRASAPIARDIKILKIKPERRVKAVKKVISTTVFIRFFIV